MRRKYYFFSKILSTAKKERQLYTYLPGRDFLLYPGERCPGDTPQSVTYGYLSVFNNLKWEPVAYAGPREGRFLFKDVGYRVFIT